jgi:hypothetical protein
MLGVSADFFSRSYFIFSGAAVVPEGQQRAAAKLTEYVSEQIAKVKSQAWSKLGPEN